METDDEAQLIINKWPFYVGDVFLVLIALSIALLGDWNLTDWQVLACVVSVALGAALLVLPFVLEFYARAQEADEGRVTQLYLLRRQVQAAEGIVEAANVRIHQLEETLAGQVKSVHVVSNLVDRKLATLDCQLADVSERMLSLAGVVAQVPDPEFVPSVRPLLDDLETRVQALGDQADLQQALLDRIESLERTVAAAATVAAAPEELPVPVARKRLKIEPRLLRRAIEVRPATELSAVSRIIGPSLQRPVAGLTVESRPVAAVNSPLEATADEPSIEAVVSQITSPPSASAVDLFAETVPVVDHRGARKRKGDSVVAVSILIGIGNKPYLRGSGGGLSWDRGVAMDFKEAGKWGWVAPADFEGLLELQIFCNDEQPDRDGKYTLEPGQKLEITPIF